PWANGVLAFLRVALLAALAGVFISLRPDFWKSLWERVRGVPGAAAALLLLCLSVVAVPRAAMAQAQQAQQNQQAETNVAAPVPPPAGVLEQLEQRLTAPPDCHPNCASSSRMALEVTPSTLLARIELGASAE